MKQLEQIAATIDRDEAVTELPTDSLVQLIELVQDLSRHISVVRIRMELLEKNAGTAGYRDDDPRR